MKKRGAEICRAIERLTKVKLRSKARNKDASEARRYASAHLHAEGFMYEEIGHYIGRVKSDAQYLERKYVELVNDSKSARERAEEVAAALGTTVDEVLVKLEKRKRAWS